MTRLLSLAIVSLMFSTPLALACDYPQRVKIPNGATATKDEMIAGQRAVKDYMASMDEYLACIEKEEKDTLATLPELTDEEREVRASTLVKRHNAAVEEMELVAARFNEEVRAYKAKSE